jgi:hypothetical protein
MHARMITFRSETNAVHRHHCVEALKAVKMGMDARVLRWKWSLAAACMAATRAAYFPLCRGHFELNGSSARASSDLGGDEGARDPTLLTTNEFRRCTSSRIGSLRAMGNSHHWTCTQKWR